MMHHTHQVSGRIPAAMARALALLSAQTGETIQAMLIDGLDRAIRARAKGVPFALPWPEQTTNEQQPPAGNSPRRSKRPTKGAQQQ